MDSFEKAGWSAITMCWVVGAAIFLWSGGCASFPATREAGLRRMGEAKLDQCRKMGNTGCLASTRAWCVAHGMELDCGEGAIR